MKLPQVQYYTQYLQSFKETYMDKNWKDIFKKDMETEAFHQGIVDKSNEKQLTHLEETKKMLNESVDEWLEESK